LRAYLRDAILQYYLPLVQSIIIQRIFCKYPREGD
jgi:hypothetical protein